VRFSGLVGVLTAVGGDLQTVFQSIADAFP
jgi:Flp pilus assembly pilin Flp